MSSHHFTSFTSFTSFPQDLRDDPLSVFAAVKMVTIDPKTEISRERQQMTDLTKYAVFDTETTGPKPQEDHIIEIAWLVNDQGNVKVGNHLIDHGQPISEKITEITGITTELINESGVSPFQAFRDFFIDVQGLPLIGHNVLRFDKPFVIKEMARLGVMAWQVQEFDRRQFYDTAALFKGFMMEELIRDGETHEQYAMRILDTPVKGLRYSLEHCCSTLELKLEGKLHRALADVMATHSVFQWCYERGLV